MKIAKLLNVSIEEQASALSALFDLFKEKKYEPVFKDLKLEIAPSKDDENAYVCCEQKIIHWDGTKFLISCLYNSHPTLQFATKEEVVSFYEGYFNAEHNDIAQGDAPNSTAYNNGLVLFYYEQFGENSNVGQKFAKAISDLQINVSGEEKA
jgi:hypothetical protein